MKKKFLVLIFIFVLLAFFAFKGVTNILGKTESQDNGLRFEIATTKQTFLLGEVIPLSFRLTNTSNTAAPVFNCVDGRNGKLQILISENSQDYKVYKNYRWSRSESIPKPLILKAGESLEHTTEIIWNYVPNVVDRQVFADKFLVTDFVFTKQGNYFIKATCVPYFRSPIIESAPIQITIREPLGEDKEIWNRIKNDPEFAYFLQEGDIRIRAWEQEKRGKFQREVDDIVNRHPNSFITGQLRKSIEKFNQKEAKRREAFEKMNKPNRP